MRKGFIELFFKFSFGGWIAAAIAFFSTPIITALILPAEFGKASFVLLAYNFLLQLILLGLDQSFVREYYGVDADKRPLLLKKAMAVPLIFSVGVGMVFIALYRQVSYFLIDAVDFNIVVLLVLTTVVATVERFTTLNIRMAKKATLFSVLKIASSLINALIVILYATVVEKDLYAVVYGNLAALLVCASISCWVMRNDLLVSGKCEVTVKALLKYGIPFIPAFLVGWFFEAIDKVALKEFSTFTEMGLYAAAFKIVAVLTIIQSTFSTFWTPIAYEAYEENSSETKEMFQQAFQILSAVFFVSSLLIIMFKDLIIRLFSSEYTSASVVMPYLVFIPVLYTLSEVTVGGINFHKRTSLHLVISSICAIVNILGVLVLVPIFGAKGAALSTACAYVIFFYLRTWFSLRLFPIEFLLYKFTFSLAMLFGIATLNTFVYNDVILMFSNIAAVSVTILVYLGDFRKLFLRLKGTLLERL